MYQTNFNVVEVFQTQSEEARKERLQAIVTHYLKSRLSQLGSVSMPCNP